MTRQYQCRRCRHVDNHHEQDDKGQCLVNDCMCEGIL